jgi:hypothetical protein
VQATARARARAPPPPPGARERAAAAASSAAPLLPDDLMIPYGYLNLASPMKTLQSVMPMHEL